MRYESNFIWLPSCPSAENILISLINLLANYLSSWLLTWPSRLKKTQKLPCHMSHSQRASTKGTQEAGSQASLQDQLWQISRRLLWESWYEVFQLKEEAELLPCCQPWWIMDLGQQADTGKCHSHRWCAVVRLPGEGELPEQPSSRRLSYSAEGWGED